MAKVSLLITPARSLHLYSSANNYIRLQTTTVNGYSGVEFANDAQTWTLGVINNDTFALSNAAQFGGGYPFQIEKSAPNNSFIVKTSGNVGIGTASPDAPLQIACGTAGLPITSAATGSLSVGSISSTTSASILGRQTASTTGLTLVAATVDGNTSGDMVFNARGNHNGTFSTLTNAAFKFSHYTSDLLVIRRNGNVGIGTITADFRLRIVAADSAGVMAVKNTANGRDTFRSENASGTRTFNIGNDSSGAGLALIRNASGVTTTYLSGDGNSYIAGGNLGVGAVAGNTRLEVKGATSGSSAFGFLVRNSSNTSLFSIRNDGRIDIPVGSVHVGSGNITLGGTGRIQGVDTVTDATDAANKAYVDNAVGVGGPFLPLAGGTMTGVAGVVFPDAFKLNLGTGSDLQIYHDGSDSIIHDNGTGNLKIRATNFRVLNAAGTQNMISHNDGGDVKLYHAGLQKLATTSTGISVTGDVGIGITNPTEKLEINGNTYTRSKTRGIATNYATSEGWVASTAVSSAIGYFGGNFTSNGPSTESKIEYDIGPFGARELIWKTIPETVSNDDGGWNKALSGFNNSAVNGFISVVYDRP